MPLIPSHRHTQADLKAWEDYARYDKALGPSTYPKATRAIKTLQKFGDQQGGYISCSWGKDSTAVAHLAIKAGLNLPLVWVRVKHWENPDCVLVRDAFLAKYGYYIDYHEITVESAAPRRWEAPTQGKARTSTNGFKQAAKRYGKRHISGVRGAESKDRSLAMAAHGEISAHSCRPIGNWSNEDVFSYLTHHDLPIHPAYAQLMGGAKHRDHIRVGTLGGSRGTELGRAQWERTYYPEIVQA